MSSFSEMCFSPAEFAALAKIDRNEIVGLEEKGLLKTTRKRVGNVDRKMVNLAELQRFFQDARHRRHELQASSTASSAPMGDGAETAGVALPSEIGINRAAELTGFAALAPRHKVQMFYNVKGGTGKSTLTAQYAMRAAMMGLNVLALDLDGQGHLTVNLDILDAHERPTVYDVLINDLPMADAILPVAPCLDLVPANLGLCNIEIPLNNKSRREYRLSEALSKVADRYDLIVADTNPAASILNGSMLVASGLVAVVCATNPLSFHGMSLVMAT
ncbi:MAG: AAA family ATPase, partial [Bdellovibrionota bacterium]